MLVEILLHDKLILRNVVSTKESYLVITLKNKS